MTKRALFLTILTVMLSLLLVMSLSAKTGTKMDIKDGNRFNNVNNFNFGQHPMMDRSASRDLPMPEKGFGNSGTRVPVGSALSPNVGIGKGEPIDETFDDVQRYWGTGRHITNWMNVAGTEVSVHFLYRDSPDTIPGWPFSMTGYNMYDATVAPSGDWPRGQGDGCDIQGTDTIGYGAAAYSMDMMHTGEVVIAATSNFFSDTLSDGSAYTQNMYFFQSGAFNCSFSPGLNVTFIDSLTLQSNFTTTASLERDPQICTQYDGGNTITHVLIGQNDGTPFTGADYVDNAPYGYATYTYYRKVGTSIFEGTWSSGQIIDSLWFVWTSMSAAPEPYSGVAVTYCNPSYWGAQLNEIGDQDIWLRESPDKGLSWPPSYSITDYQNAIAGHPNHYTAWLESNTFYDSDGDLHVFWGAKPTSANPYFDNFNWSDFDQNLYHWAKSSDEIVKVANGAYTNLDGTGSINTVHCGFGGSNALYIAFATMGECDGKLYMLWSQFHNRANLGDYFADPTLLDDCSYIGNRGGMANWEIMMSVAQKSSSSLWDPARNVTNTYTPNCGLPGDTEAPGGLCGSEWKPFIERFALDETGLTLYWPAAAIVDMTPDGDPAYTGGHYINFHYMDDQFPGPGGWGSSDNFVNPPLTENSEKWIRLACVEPVEAALISVTPKEYVWPNWVKLGEVSTIPITINNEGNVTLEVSDLSFAPAASWLGASVSPTPSSTFDVPAGVVNSNTFDMTIDATSLSSTQWLEGTITITSNAADFPSFDFKVKVLAADTVEPVVWDTVQSHADMFDPYGSPVGGCVALAVGNHGEMGYALAGEVNLDFFQSGLECGTRDRDKVYLATASPYILDADGGGSNVLLSTSPSLVNQAEEYSFDPISTLGSITGGERTGLFDSVYTGQFVNRDTTVAMERIVYAPRDNNDSNSFVIVATKFYSADGNPHNNITVGNLVDWDVPANNVPSNTSGVSITGNFTYVQGTDTVGNDACQANVNRFGAEAFGGGYTAAEYNLDTCSNSTAFWGSAAFNQLLMEDTNLDRSANPIDPRQPDAQAWWDDIGAYPDLTGWTTDTDQAVWTTFVYDYDLSATDTVHYWTVLSTVRNGSLADLEAQVAYARNWYTSEVRGCSVSCCVGRVGDANNSGVDEPTIGDISVMIDMLFISGDLVDCMLEADINQSGGTNPVKNDVTIGDISILIDYLFITGKSLGLNNCL